MMLLRLILHVIRISNLRPICCLIVRLMGTLMRTICRQDKADKVGKVVRVGKADKEAKEAKEVRITMTMMIISSTEITNDQRIIISNI